MVVMDILWSLPWEHEPVTSMDCSACNVQNLLLALERLVRLRFPSESAPEILLDSGHFAALFITLWNGFILIDLLACRVM